MAIIGQQSQSLLPILRLNALAASRFSPQPRTGVGLATGTPNIRSGRQRMSIGSVGPQAGALSPLQRAQINLQERRLALAERADERAAKAAERKQGFLEKETGAAREERKEERGLQRTQELDVIGKKFGLTKEMFDKESTLKLKLRSMDDIRIRDLQKDLLDSQATLQQEKQLFLRQQSEAGIDAREAEAEANRLFQSRENNLNRAVGLAEIAAKERIAGVKAEKTEFEKGVERVGQKKVQKELIDLEISDELSTTDKGQVKSFVVGGDIGSLFKTAGQPGTRRYDVVAWFASKIDPKGLDELINELESATTAPRQQGITGEPTGSFQDIKGQVGVSSIGGLTTTQEESDRAEQMLLFLRSVKAQQGKVSPFEISVAPATPAARQNVLTGAGGQFNNQVGGIPPELQPDLVQGDRDLLPLPPALDVLRRRLLTGQ